MPNDELKANYDSIVKGVLPGAELVIGLVGAVGADLQRIAQDLTDILPNYGYSDVEAIRVSNLIQDFASIPKAKLAKEPQRTHALMTAGDRVRRKTRNEAIMALAAVAHVFGKRKRDDEKRQALPKPRNAYIINSLKHPAEVNALRRIYGNGFFLLGVYVEEGKRRDSLIHRKNITPTEADDLMKRDAAEGIPHGQHTSDTFHLSDFFIHLLDDEDQTRAALQRILDLLFGNPFRTPLFDEYGMFMAFSAATRSADLSRQIGAVIARDEEVLAAGANECPRFGGGAYWPFLDRLGQVSDVEKGRDYTWGYDSNDRAKAELIRLAINRVKEKWKEKKKELSAEEEALLQAALESSPIDDITEYGRVVHAEMNALLSCARNNISCQGATLYTTTFPCHNCAKHVIAAGIVRVVYIEPYPKSRAFQFHPDSVYDGFCTDPGCQHRVAFEPFVGVGPRQFFNLFSMKQGSGFPMKRKDSKGNRLSWTREDGKIRIPMLPWNYLQREEFAVGIQARHRKGVRNGHEGGNPSKGDPADSRGDGAGNPMGSQKRQVRGHLGGSQGKGKGKRKKEGKS